MKYKCLIIDDEPVARKILQEFIEEIDYLELVAQAENPVKAMQLLREHAVDIIFLDINMPKINGVDFLKTTRPDAKIIMTTAYAEYAVEAFELDVLDYLVKPVAFERFVKACNKAREVLIATDKISPVTADHFFVKCNNQLEKVLYDELIYAEAMLNYVMLYTTTKKLMVYVTIKALEDQLPANRFLKVHKSFIINTDKVKSIESNVIDMGTAKVTISQNLKDKVMQEIIKDRMIKR